MVLFDFRTAVQIDRCSICKLRGDGFNRCSHAVIALPPPSTLVHGGEFYRVYDELSVSQYYPKYVFLSGNDSHYLVTRITI
jgi:hypothetical protein